MSVARQSALKRLAFDLVSTLVDGVVVTGILLWDMGLSVYNLFAPTVDLGKLVPPGHPGFRGKWPEFVPPGEGDSRCSCPALNAMANHGIIPRDGRNIRFRDLTAAIRHTYNFAPTFCIFVPRYMAQILDRSYVSGTLDLEDVDVHNGIEHDASLTREDAFFLPSQSQPSPSRVQELLACASGPALPPSVMPVKPSEADAKLNLNRSLTLADLARLTSKRRAESRKHNPQFSLSTFHKMFGSSKCALFLHSSLCQTAHAYGFAALRHS
ncbi:heme-thiolate peroxidase [Hericium alpestre]|uniref:Heme-thiolate peroxidase n=1 Tax=Hericium alpestre TaxID=135208 RepID=A0A4Y9ZYC1_9AGAM|nr:heme-thiolate peroxidase [Hericium alpestre]